MPYRYTTPPTSGFAAFDEISAGRSFTHYREMIERHGYISGWMATADGVGERFVNRLPYQPEEIINQKIAAMPPCPKSPNKKKKPKKAKKPKIEKLPPLPPPPSVSHPFRFKKAVKAGDSIPKLKRRMVKIENRFAAKSQLVASLQQIKCGQLYVHANKSGQLWVTVKF